MGPLWAPGSLQLGAEEQGEFVWLSKALGGTIREAPRVSQEDRGSPGKLGWGRRAGGWFPL